MLQCFSIIFDGRKIIFTSQNRTSVILGCVLSQGLAAGSLLADQAEASPAQRSADHEPPMLASLHCKHSCVHSS